MGVDYGEATQACSNNSSPGGGRADVGAAAQEPARAMLSASARREVHRAEVAECAAAGLLSL
jgi:hypothetical protein